MRDAPGRFDLTMLHAAYGAFRRDVDWLAADGGSSPVAADVWTLFSLHWRAQQAAERRALWSVMRHVPGGASGRAAALDAMDALAVRVVPLIDAMDAAVEHHDARLVTGYARDLRQAVRTLLAHKEENVLPLIHDSLTAFEWGTFDVEFRHEIGVRGLRLFLPWVLDGAPEPTRRAVLGMQPVPIRLVCRRSWLPRYRRRRHGAVPAF
ncbi:hypothetical protein [Actinomadura sp. WMMB 499]|uniref:hypothetical protein n=1 Tax=Actinomadura sp. WMMB 499 TaxID=1219491 RepID=UPI001249466C|nr:hypothetical protein [Actinomadura sp. WMMB 499]QFG20336.1 hypothetical protein F7P10_03265 [Actinomadura sp. WMMB 499]